MREVNVYHLRTQDTEKVVGGKTIKVGGQPYATVAIEINKDGTVNRGVAICSAKDVFIKKVGTKKALGRLESAKLKKSSVCAIASFLSTQKRILKKIGGEAKYTKTTFNYLGEYHALPTLDELDIFKSDFEYRCDKH